LRTVAPVVSARRLAATPSVALTLMIARVAAGS
jgi:hypothetical protein